MNPRTGRAGLPGVRTAVRLTGGWIGTTWHAELTDGRDVVVKQCPYPAEVEADGFAALAAAGVPVPDVLGVAGRTLVMQFVQGTPDWPAVGCRGRRHAPHHGTSVRLAPGQPGRSLPPAEPMDR